MVTLGRNRLFFSAALMAIGVATTQSLGVTDWQTAAGEKMAFEVASVKPTKGFRPFPFPLDIGDAKTPGGRFSFSSGLIVYVGFAYKLSPGEVITQLPKSFPTDTFEIEARAGGNPTKDQMRLMMQSLLADRFKLRIHFETHEGPVYALTLVRPGHTGPKLRPHADGPACPDSFEMSAVMPALPRNASDVFPPACGATETRGTREGTVFGGRDVTVETFAWAIHNFGSLTGEIDKPVVDQTGLKGRYDFILQLPARILSFSAAPPNPDDPLADPKGTPFLNALREQLGLKLVSSKGPIRRLVVDHAEPPSAN
jgi:bla regulator protein blaR1